MASGRPREYHIKEIVELFADEAEENTSTSVEEKDDEVDETATLPSSSKLHYNCMQDKLSSIELHTLKREFRTTKDELAKVASSNRALRKRVSDLEEMLEIKELKKRNGGLYERDEGHDEVDSPHINEGGNNDMSPLHEYITPTTESA
ncbi:unnamed protein product [Prunus armeniaca]